MPDLVVGASVILELLGRTERTDRLLEALRAGVPVAPGLIDLEVVSTLARWERGGARSAAQCASARSHFRRLHLARRPLGDLIDQAWELRGPLRIADAFYVALARELDAPLLTTDDRLARVCRDQSLCDVVVPTES